MVELLYPFSPAKIFGPKLNASEMCPIVEPSGLVVGQAAREYFHSDKTKPLHPVVHLQIIDRDSRIYLQKRGPHKDLYPGKWDTAVGGHVTYGEGILEALRREAGEELGFNDFNEIEVDSFEFESPWERELVCLFAAVGHFNIKPDNYEVQYGRYWTPQEIEQNLGKSVFTPNFENEYIKYRERLEALL